MKPITFIMPLALFAASTVFAVEDAPADSYPELPELADLFAVQAAETAAFPEIKDPGDAVQIANAAPLIVVAELPMAGDAVALAQSALTPAVVALKEVGAPESLADAVKPPALALVKDAGDPVTLAATVKPLPITVLAEPTVPDLFTINRLFKWDKPHGQWMNQMLKDIEAAQKAGDVETYNTLAARYSTWAEKYLRKDNPPNLDGSPGH
jgi:hypothetical protein